MARQRGHKPYRQPNREEDEKIYDRGYDLDELFSSKEILDLIGVARLRIIGEFFYAKDFARGRKRSTDNYIIGVGPKLKELARYVNRSTHRPFIRKENLPSQLQELRPALVEKITVRAQYDMLLIALQAMRHHEVYYDEALGIWQVIQSSMDDYLQLRYTAGRQVKFDRRNYHGRVRSQSKNRDIPPGQSVGFS